MEMTEDIYVNAGYFSDKVQTQNQAVHYRNAEKGDKASDSHTADPQYTGLSTADRRCSRLAAVRLGLLCVLLLAAITVLWIKFWMNGETNNQRNEDLAEILGPPDKKTCNDRPCPDKEEWICERKCVLMMN
ncbi:hypothetical protein SRHO_G00250790 [Serrasalmus rhombeus]